MRIEGASTSPRTEPVQVLSVDDSPELRESLCFALADGGWPVLQAANGVEALAVLRATPRPTVVLLDLVMPELDGVGVLEAVASEPELSAPRLTSSLQRAPGWREWRSDCASWAHLKSP